MKTMMALMTVALAAGASTPAGDAPRNEAASAAAAPVESFILEEVGDVNAEIDRAAEAEEDWVLDPVRIALNVIEQGPDAIEERRYLSLTFEGGQDERPGACTVTVVTDGYLDDSMRGEWCRLTIERGDDEQWRVSEFRHAWRCYRGYVDSTGVSHPKPHDRFTSDACL